MCASMYIVFFILSMALFFLSAFIPIEVVFMAYKYLLLLIIFYFLYTVFLVPKFDKNYIKSLQSLFKDAKTRNWVFWMLWIYLFYFIPKLFLIICCFTLLVFLIIGIKDIWIYVFSFFSEWNFLIKLKRALIPSMEEGIGRWDFIFGGIITMCLFLFFRELYNSHYLSYLFIFVCYSFLITLFLSLSFRRLKDLGASFWWILFFFVSIFSCPFYSMGCVFLFYFLIIAFTQRAENKKDDEYWLWNKRQSRRIIFENEFWKSISFNVDNLYSILSCVFIVYIIISIFSLASFLIKEPNIIEKIEQGMHSWDF